MKNRFTRLLSKVTTASLLAMSLAAVTPASAATVTASKDTLSRLKAAQTAVTHSVTFTVTSFTATIDYAFDAGFTSQGGTAAATCTGGTVAVTNTGNTFHLVPTTCSAGAVTLTGLTFTNPSAGTYTNTISGQHSGTVNIPIISDDQVTVTATVSPNMSFNVGANATCDVNFAGNGGTVALGTLSTGAISSSSVSSVNVICTRLSSNATSGTQVTVLSTNASLKSTSASTDSIPSASAAMSAGTANYGLCLDDITGKSVTVPVGGTLTANIASACTNSTAAGTVTGVTGATQNLWSVNAGVSNAYWELQVKAAISGTTPAHNDYTDTLTFIATGTF